MLRAGLSALLSHWRRHPLQLAMLLLGLSLATALWSGVQAINAEARASYARAAAVLGQDTLSAIVTRDGSPLAQTDYIALRRAGWQVSPVLEGRLDIEGARLRLLGIDPITLPRAAQGAEVADGDTLLQFITPPGLMQLSPETAADLPDIPVMIADLPPGVAMVDIGQAQRLLEAPGQITRLLLDPDAPVPADLPAPLVLQTPDAGNDLARLTDSFHLNLTAFGFLAFAVGLFIVHSAIGLAFEQRRATFRTLRALGLSARALTGLLAAELLVLAVVAGALGVALGYLVAAVLLPDVAATLRGLYGAEVPRSLTLRPSWWAAGLGIAVLGTFVAAAQSLWRLAHLPILAPAQPRAWARADAMALRWQAALGVGLLAVALLLGLIGRGLWSGFGVLAGLLLGAALLLPVLLMGLAALGQALSRGVLAQWFWADTRQQLPGLSLALMALLLALAANVGVGTMVASFRLTFTGWLDQRLAAELYLTARTEDEAAAMIQWLAPRTDAILPIWPAEAQVETAAGTVPATVYGVVDHPTYRDHWPLLQAVPDVWDRLRDGDVLLVNEQLARRDGLALGDPVSLAGRVLPLGGIYSDYGNPEAQAIIDNDLLVALFPDVPRLRYGLRLPPEDAAALRDDIIDSFDLPPGNILDQASVKAFSLQIFERTFAVTAALNVLTLGVAALAMFASLMTLSGMRLPQLAPVWAMGLTRRRLALLELGRTLALAGLTLVVALPLGLALAWVLLAVVNVAAFGWRLPLHLFPADWLRLAVLALLAALVAAIIPVRRLARIAPSDLLRVFANER